MRVEVSFACVSMHYFIQKDAAENRFLLHILYRKK